jgi:hypothetical protein
VNSLTKSQVAFKTEEITYLDRKSILLDRMLLRLFELLRYDGRKVHRRRTRSVDVATVTQAMLDNPGRFPGFGAHPEIARAWLRNDLLEIMNRGRGSTEVVVGPRPFHLSAFKLANPKAAQDYGASDQVWALLYHADRPILAQLKEFFGRGLDPALDRYDKSTILDLETLAVLGLADDIEVSPATAAPAEPTRPLCMAQGRILADDLRRLLAYDGTVPRNVLADYIRNVIGLHLALLMLRLLRLVPHKVDEARHAGASVTCPAEDKAGADCANCPFGAEITVDMTDDPASPPGLLARRSAVDHYGRIPEYVRAVFTVNRLKDYAQVLAASGRRAQARSLADLLSILHDLPSDAEGFFGARIADVLTRDDHGDEEEDPIVRQIVASDMTSMDRFVELICLQRLRNEAKRVTELVDSLTQKNRPGGFLRQTVGRRAPRWFVMSSGLLETLAQIAVVERNEGRLDTRPVLLDDFVSWLRRRYGFVIYAPTHREVPPDEYAAWQQNERALRDRLHEIGFFVDLSDAYNSQTLRPRYQLGRST